MVLRLSLLLSGLLVATQNNAHELSLSDNPIYYFDGSKAIDVTEAPRFSHSRYPFNDETFEDSLIHDAEQYEKKNFKTILTPAKIKENMSYLKLQLDVLNNEPSQNDKKFANLLLARQANESFVSEIKQEITKNMLGTYFKKTLMQIELIEAKPQEFKVARRNSL